MIVSEINERVELLIGRKLDGEATPDEQLELDRELLRSPEARALLETYDRIDAEARDVLREVVRVGDGGPLRLVTADCRSGRYASVRRNWMLYASALAACLALALLVKTPGARSPRQGGQPPVMVQTTPSAGWPEAVGGPRAVPVTTASDVGVYRVGDFGRQRTERFTNRDYLLVPGSDGRLYLLQVDTTRERRRPTEDEGVHFVKDPI